MRCMKLNSSLNYINSIAIHETWNVHATSILYGSWLILNTTRNHQRSIHVCLKVNQNGGIQKLADETKCKPDTIIRDRLNPTKCHLSHGASNENLLILKFLMIKPKRSCPISGQPQHWRKNRVTARKRVIFAICVSCYSSYCLTPTWTESTDFCIIQGTNPSTTPTSKSSRVARSTFSVANFRSILVKILRTLFSYLNQISNVT